MFNFQQSHDLGDQKTPFFLSPQEDNVHYSLFSPEINLFPVTGGGRKKQKRPPENQESKKVAKENENKQKKSTHCEIERQRRQEMANLYASLRNLLPLEYIKGKRSTSDHMHEAVNYINHLQKNIRQLSLKNETLNNKPNLSTDTSGNASSESCSTRRRSSTVKLNLCRNGVEILISFCPKDEVFPMSRVLNKLVVQGFDVISYLSSRSDDGSILYKILAEVDDPSCIDIIGLQKTLTNMITKDLTAQ